MADNNKRWKTRYARYGKSGRGSPSKRIKTILRDSAIVWLSDDLRRLKSSCKRMMKRIEETESHLETLRRNADSI